MALSGGFFCQPGEPHPCIEYFQDVLMIEVKMREHHQRVKPEVGHLIDRASVSPFATVSFAASITSVASSPTFSRIVFSPSAFKEAT